jgi:hypothetical protein
MTIDPCRRDGRTCAKTTRIEVIISKITRHCHPYIVIEGCGKVWNSGFQLHPPNGKLAYFILSYYQDRERPSLMDWVELEEC